VPIYEYDCHDCRRRVSLLVLRPSAAPPPTCPRCGGASLTRLLSRFASPRSEDARIESLADESNFADFDENDPGSVARFMKRMGRELGDDLGDDLDSAVDEALAESATGDDTTDAASASDSSDSDL
jgi:putative FmdB family regulatory protein